MKKVQGANEIVMQTINILTSTVVVLALPLPAVADQKKRMELSLRMLSMAQDTLDAAQKSLEESYEKLNGGA